jgi:hypothetical protein
LQPLPEGREASLFFGIVCDPVHEHADATLPVGLLSVRSKRQSGCHAPEKRDELEPPHGSPSFEDHTLSHR